MTRSLRPGKVFLDWSQNAAAKTTVAPYSLRARATPSVSTPINWDEVEACRSPDDLVFVAADVVKRVERDGDLLADLVTLSPNRRARLPVGTPTGGAR
jgi:bifunctional non-homologous end joining protein LigD